MITAYFDDSGTHGDKSNVVPVAGIFGTQSRMEGLGQNWKRLLMSPVDGLKQPIKRFHAFDCDQSMGEFERWTRTETDYFRRQLRGAIIEADVAAFGMACFRSDYDELVTGPVRSVLGTAEGFCINQCFVRSVGWAQANTFDSEMCFVFHNRPPPVQRYTGAVYDAFERWTQPPPVMKGVSFQNSTKEVLLQAADLIAWELNRYANRIVAQGLSAPTQPELLHLKSNMLIDAQVANRRGITEVCDHWRKFFEDKPGWLEQFARHFDTFDPQQPDYSHLSDGKSSPN